MTKQEILSAARIEFGETYHRAMIINHVAVFDALEEIVNSELNIVKPVEPIVFMGDVLTADPVEAVRNRCISAFKNALDKICISDFVDVDRATMANLVNALKACNHNHGTELRILICGDLTVSVSGLKCYWNDAHPSEERL